jgi:hypothetical protein
MPQRNRHEAPVSDEIERELEKLRGFGSTLLLALGTSALLFALITAVLWWIVF